MSELARHGVVCGAALSPLLPFISDRRDNLSGLISSAASYGASFILPAFSLRLKSSRRETFYRRVEALFPGVSLRYANRYGGLEILRPKDEGILMSYAESLCGRLGLAFGTEQAVARVMGHEQIRLF